MSKKEQHEKREKEYEKELIGAEATIMFLKASIEWLKSLINDRENIMASETGHHYPAVENLLIKTATKRLKIMEANLKNAIEAYGEYPHVEYMDKKIKALGLEVEA